MKASAKHFILVVGPFGESNVGEVIYSIYLAE